MDACKHKLNVLGRIELNKMSADDIEGKIDYR